MPAARVHIAPRFQQRIAMALRFAGLAAPAGSRERPFRSGKVRPDPLQDSRAQKEIVADAIVRSLDVLQRLDAVDAGEGRQHQQASESGHQDHAAVQGGSQHSSGSLWRQFGPARLYGENAGLSGTAKSYRKP